MKHSLLSRAGQAHVRVLIFFMSALAVSGGAGRAAEAMAETAPKPADLARMGFEELANIRVTTVSREASTVGQTPAAVSVITQEMIRRSGAREIPELLRMVPGLDVARIDGNKWAIGSRGFNNRFQHFLLVQVDGRSVFSPQTAGVFWDAVAYPLEDIERIEVIRGPGASVWGANAVNGVINIITKSSKDTQGGMLAAGGGSTERGFADFRFGGKIGENVTYRLYGQWADHARQFSLEGNTNDQWREYHSGLRVDWRPNAQDTLTFDAAAGRSVTGTNDRFARRQGPLFAPNVPEDDTTDVAHILARWTRQIDPDSSMSVQAYWDFWRRTDTNDFRNTAFDTFDLDFQHQFRLGQRQKIVWGLEYRYVDAHLDNSANDGGFSLDWLDNRPHSQLFSGFVQDQITLVEDRLSLTLGTKLEHNSFTGFEVQPTGRVLWTPSKRQSVWAAVSRAVRTPSFTEDDAQFTVPQADPTRPPVARVVANRELESEEVWAYELGYRIQATDAFSVDAALFYNVYNGIRINRSNPSLAANLPAPLFVASQFYNGMDGETYGLEVAANWRVATWWRLYGSYSVLKSNLHADPSLPLAAQRGSGAEGIEGQNPQQQVYVRSSWNLPRNVEFDLTGRYVDRLGGFNPGGIPGVSDTVADYVSLDARLAWRPCANVELSLVGQNLLDNHHPEFGTNPFIRSPLIEIRRSVYGMVTWHF